MVNSWAYIWKVLVMTVSVWQTTQWKSAERIILLGTLFWERAGIGYLNLSETSAWKVAQSRSLSFIVKGLFTYNLTQTSFCIAIDAGAFDAFQLLYGIWCRLILHVNWRRLKYYVAFDAELFPWQLTQNIFIFKKKKKINFFKHLTKKCQESDMLKKLEEGLKIK